MFDEAFLRQLERLLLLVRAPVRGGLKGGRRSVKRGQSVEFADYRDYTLGDDLRQLDWNVYARLERLLVKLFVEEEDLTVTLLVDASASMAGGHPEKLRFAKRAAAALGYVGLASEDKISVSALGGRAARRQVALRGSGRVFRLLTALSGDRGRRMARPTSSRRPATRRPSSAAGASSCSSATCSTPAAETVIRDLAATGSELVILHILGAGRARPADRGRPAARGRRERRPAWTSPLDLATVDAYKARLAAWQAGLADLAARRAAAYVPLVLGRAARGRDLRRAAAPSRGRLTDDAVPGPARPGRPRVRPARRRLLPAQAAPRRARSCRPRCSGSGC